MKQPGDKEPAAPIAIYFGINILSNFYRGLHIVLLAWTALQVGGTLASVGQIFVIGHLLNVVVGPGIGSVIDEISNRKAFAIGQSLLTIGCLGPALFYFSGADFRLLHLMAFALLSALGGLVMIGAMDSLFQGVVPVDDRRRIAANLGGFRQAAMVLGAGGGGLIIHYFGIGNSFLIAAASSIFVLIGVFLMPVYEREISAVEKNYRTYFQNIREGFQYVLGKSEVLYLAFAIALAFSAGQLSNALLPAFIRDDIGADSQLYGIVDAAWSVGGVAAAFLVGRWLRFKSLRLGEYATLIGLGAVTMVFGQLEIPILLIATHLLMGALFSWSRVLSDGRLLEICDNKVIGRVRVNIQVLTSFIGLIVYTAPTLLPSLTAANFYFSWGLAITVGGAFIFVLARKQQPDPTHSARDAVR